MLTPVKQTQLLIGLMGMGAAIVGTVELLPRGADQATSDNSLEIIQQSETLYRSITVSTDAFTVSTHKGLNYSMHRGTLPDLVVQVAPVGDELGTGVVFDWNCLTGELISIRHGGAEFLGAELPLLCKEEVARVSESWLLLLGLVDPSLQHKRPPEPSHFTKWAGSQVLGTYTIRWSLPDREIKMTLQDRTGDLMSVDVRTFAKIP